MKKTAGFTLVELIVVIAILAILAGIAIPVYSGYIKKANEAADYQQLDAIKTAAVFVATDKDADHICTVDSMTVNKNNQNVTVGSSKGDLLDKNNAAITSVDVSVYATVPETFKSGADSATWDGSNWTLTYPAP